MQTSWQDCRNCVQILHKRKWIFYKIWTIALKNHHGQYILIHKQANKHIVIHILWFKKFFCNDENIAFKKTLFLCITNKGYFNIKKRFSHDERVTVDVLYIIKKQKQNFFCVSMLIIKKKRHCKIVYHPCTVMVAHETIQNSHIFKVVKSAQKEFCLVEKCCKVFQSE